MQYALRLLGVLALLLAFRTPAHATVINAASCTPAAVTTAIGLAASGDTVQLPTCNVVWTSGVTVAKNIVLQGNGCTLDDDDRPTACNTKIANGIDAGTPMITWTCPANSPDNRISQIEITNDDGPSAATGIINISCNSSGTTRFRVDHNIFDGLNTHSMFVTDVIGVADHNRFTMSQGNYIVYGFNPSWQGVGAHGDNSWAQAADYGSVNFFIFEDNYIDYSAGAGGNACWDNHTGFRGVARFNVWIKCYFERHGTDSSGRDRGGRAGEFYGNEGDQDGAPSVQMTDLRSGSAMIFDNVKTNVEAGFTNTAATLVTDRALAFFVPFGIADGRNAWDVNPANPVNPGADAGCTSTTCTASSAGTLTVTVAGANWTMNEWQDNADPYIIRKTSACAARNCSAVLVSNTADTITFANAGGFGADLAFAAGNTFEINRLTEALDQPGRGAGSLVASPKSCSAFTSSGTSATATCASHGFSSTNYVAIRDFGGVGFYDGTYQITVTDPDTFTFTCRATCGASTAGDATVKPAAMNDQIDEPVYEWNNFTNGALVHSRSGYPGTRENEHFYNYTLSFNGTAGVGRGARGDRPASTTNGVAYWSTDRGGNWNLLNGSANDGCLDIVVAGTWSDCVYTPFTYPHPLTDSDPDTSPTPGNGGTITTASVSTTSLTLDWTKCTDTETAQADLEYRVYQSALNNIASVDDAEANGTPINAYTSDIATFGVTGLQPANVYWFNVLCRDGAGNKAAYTQVSATTSAVPSPPVVTSGGRIRARVRVR